MLNEQWCAVRNILLVRLDNLGDVLLMTPAFHAVRCVLPDARLTLLTSPVGAQIGELDPDIDEVIVYQAPWTDSWQRLAQDSVREQHMIENLRSYHFDGAIIFTSFRQSALPAAYLCYLADIPLRAAASIDGPGSLLTTRHKHPEGVLHEVERGLDLVHALGMTTTEHDLILAVPEEAKRAVAERIAHVRGQLLIVVHPGCSMPARTYPWKMYAEVVNRITAQLGAFVVLTGAKEEGELTARMLANLNEEARANTVTLAGELTFPELCALIETANLLITNNTGPMHIGAAVKTPTLALFALTNRPEQWGPWQVPHRQLYHDVACKICYSRSCPYQHECLRLVSPQMVVDAAVDLLAEVNVPIGVSGTRTREGGESVPGQQAKEIA